MTQPLAGKQILIVEDEPVFRSLMDSWLVRWAQRPYWPLMGWMHWKKWRQPSPI